MNLCILAYKNLKRRKIRSFLTIGGVAIAVAVLVSLLGFNNGYKRALTNDIDKMGYQVLVTAKGCPYEAATMMLQGGGGLKYMPEEAYNKIAKDERVDKISPHLIATVFDPEKAGGRGGVAIYSGILKNYLDLKPWIKFKSGGWFSSDTAYEAIMGYEVAELEQRSVGDKIFVPNVDKILTVVGIIERTGTQDDGLIFLPLKTAQRIFDLPGRLTGIGIKLKRVEELGEFEDALQDIPEIQIVSMAQVKNTILSLVSTARVLVTSVAVIAILVAIIGVINTILMSIFERTREIGVMKAIGASNLDIFKLVWLETILVCAAGGIGGSIIAILGGNVVEYFVKRILPYAPSGKLILITPQLLIISFIGAILLGLISGLYPAFRASSMRPIEAIRSGE